MFGERAEVTLYGWGGMAVPCGALRGNFSRFVVALAGPAAGFVLAAFTLAVAASIGAETHSEIGSLPVRVATGDDFRGS